MKLRFSSPLFSSFVSRPIFVLLPLLWLWWRLIDHLQIEWSVNPQYGYGWAVPFLGVYLIWRRMGLTLGQIAWRAGFSRYCAAPALSEVRPAGTPKDWWLERRKFLVILLGLAWLPIRLVEQANPEWRLVSWALAGDVVGLSLLLAGDIVLGLRFRGLAFPLCFFLVAVPWPTLVEGPLIQALSRANASTATELLELGGVPAMQHGNVIEIGSGAVGLDDACSGIRSLQAGLMISLFFGEFYRLRVLRRTGLCSLGLALSFGFNLTRTTLLAWVAATKGTAAIASWHDPAGVVLPLLYFGCVLALARALKTGDRRQEKGHRRQEGEERIQDSIPYCRSPHRYGGALALLIWLLAAEVVTELWYRAHEWHLPAPFTWSVALPRFNPTFSENPFSEETQRLLRFNRGLAGSWQTADGAYCQVIFLQWNPGRTAAHLASIHTPDNCLSAGGRQCVEQSELRPLSLRGLRLGFRSYSFRDSTGSVYVFYTLWQDRDELQYFQPSSGLGGNRFEAVLTGRRNCGQRSLEFAIWGAENQAAAETVLNRELNSLIQVQRLDGYIKGGCNNKFPSPNPKLCAKAL